MPASIEIGDVIAERHLTFQFRERASQKVIVRISRPVPVASQPFENWVCPFQIDGIGSRKTRGIYGADAMQALLLAIHTIPVELSVFVRDFGGQFLHWGEPDASFLDGCRSAIEYAGDEFPSARRDTRGDS
jgi:hypothetical protein